MLTRYGIQVFFCYYIAPDWCRVSTVQKWAGQVWVQRCVATETVPHTRRLHHRKEKDRYKLWKLATLQACAQYHFCLTHLCYIRFHEYIALYNISYKKPLHFPCAFHIYMWQSRVEIEGYSVAYFDRIGALKVLYR